MRFIITVIKLIIIVLLGVLLLYVVEYIQYGEVKNIIDFLKTTYPYAIFAVLVGMFAKEKIDHWVLQDRYSRKILNFLILDY